MNLDQDMGESAIIVLVLLAYQLLYTAKTVELQWKTDGIQIYFGEAAC